MEENEKLAEEVQVTPEAVEETQTAATEAAPEVKEEVAAQEETPKAEVVEEVVEVIEEAPSAKKQPKKAEKPNQSSVSSFSALNFAWELGYIIALPLVIFAVQNGVSGLLGELVGGAVNVETVSWPLRFGSHLVNLILLGSTALASSMM